MFLVIVEAIMSLSLFLLHVISFVKPWLSLKQYSFHSFMGTTSTVHHYVSSGLKFHLNLPVKNIVGKLSLNLYTLGLFDAGYNVQFYLFMIKIVQRNTNIKHDIKHKTSHTSHTSRGTNRVNSIGNNQPKIDMKQKETLISQNSAPIH